MTDDRGAIPVLAVPRLDPAAGRVDMTMPAGSTIADIVREALPDLNQHDHHRCRVTLVSERGMIVIPSDRWHRVRPAEGVRVVIRIVPGKNILRTVLMVVVAIAAAALGQYWMAPLLGGGIIGAIGGAAMAMGVTVIGNLQINALLPPVVPVPAREEEPQAVR